jgi:hypothetical protein
MCYHTDLTRAYETIDTDVTVMQSFPHHIVTVDLNRTVITIIYEKAP